MIQRRPPSIIGCAGNAHLSTGKIHHPLRKTLIGVIAHSDAHDFPYHQHWGYTAPAHVLASPLHDRAGHDALLLFDRLDTRTYMSR